MVTAYTNNDAIYCALERKYNIHIIKKTNDVARRHETLRIDNDMDSAWEIQNETVKITYFFKGFAN